MLKKIAIYFIFVLLFVIGKLGFMGFHSEVFQAYSMGDWFAALWHGLPHDLTSAGYVMAIPFLLEIVRAWFKGSWHDQFMRWYLRIITFVVVFNYFTDLVIYGAWGFRLDSTAFVYFIDDPWESMAQGDIYQWSGGLFGLVLFTWVIQKLLLLFYSRKIIDRLDIPQQGAAYPVSEELVYHSKMAQWRKTALAVLVCGLVFVAIRGGVTASTMNVGRVYFSAEMPLNHAATNPLFSFFSSVFKYQRFDQQYRFMSAEEAADAMAELNAPRAEEVAAPDSLLANRRPNIVMVILESFSGAASRVICPEIDEPSYMPNIDRLYEEGVGFHNFYANSFRTDRGVASLLASYPGQPSYSVMKDQKRCNNLQYMSSRLKENGYRLKFVHGGDVDFTNMRGFLTAGGFEDIVGDTSFPIADRLSKWGVPDNLMYEYLYNEIVADTTASAQDPYFKVMITLSSHEPFDVDYHRYDDPYVNSVAFSDSCLGVFVDKLKQSKAWDDLLLIFVPDHCYSRCPKNINNHEMLRYHIPMVWTGGAIAGHREVHTIGMQTDLSATLFGQMDIDHTDFNFSKDMMDPAVAHYAFYSFSDGFGFVTDSCCYIQDNARNGIGLSGTNDPDGKAERWGKAYLQTLYDDLQERERKR